MDYDKTVDQERKIACPECDTETYHKVIRSANSQEITEWGHFWADYEIVMCQGCRTVSFRRASGSDDIVGEDDEGIPVYDETQELFPGRMSGRKKLRQHHYLPASISGIYTETHKALCGQQPILAGIGIRTLIEAVCREKKVAGGDLKKRIDNLVAIGVLTREGSQILHRARILGNEAAHEILSLKDDDLGILMDIAENLLVNTYILPRKANELKAKND